LDPGAERVSIHAMIVAHDLVKRFGPVEAVSGLSLEIGAGRICGFLGPNGAGKTTTLRMLVGVLRPDAGRIEIDGRDALADPREARRRIGYLPDGAPGHPEMRVDELLAFRWRICGRPGARRIEVDRVVSECGLSGVRRRLVGTLSRGFRQRVGLAAALLGRPSVLLLDEPTEGLDPIQVREFRSLLRGFAEGRTVLLSSHLLAEVEAVCDEAVLVLEGRQVAAGGIDALREAAGSGLRWSCVSDLPDARWREVVASVPGASLAGGEAISVGAADGWRRREVEFAEGRERPEALAAAIVAAGGAVRELRPHRRTLEDAFVHFAGGRGR
jgi:ABC-2 type transport system ATP-binding protein